MIKTEGPGIVQAMDRMSDPSTDEGKLVDALLKDLDRGLPPYGTRPRTFEERNRKVR